MYVIHNKNYIWFQNFSLPEASRLTFREREMLINCSVYFVSLPWIDKNCKKLNFVIFWTFAEPRSRFREDQLASRPVRALHT